MAKYKNLDGNYSPSQEIWSQVCMCTNLRDTLLELAQVDKPLLSNKAYYKTMVDISTLQADH